MNFKKIVAEQALVKNIKNHWFYMSVSIVGMVFIKYFLPDEAMEDPTISIILLMFNILIGVLLISAGAQYIAPFVSKKAFAKGAEKINARYIFYLTLWREFLPHIDEMEEEAAQEIKKMKGWIAEAERGGMEGKTYARIAMDSEREVERSLWEATILILKMSMLESKEAKEWVEKNKKEYFENFYQSPKNKELKAFVLSFYFKVKDWQDKLQRQMA